MRSTTEIKFRRMPSSRPYTKDKENKEREEKMAACPKENKELRQ